MTPLATLLLAAAAASVPAPKSVEGGMGAQVERVEARATIVEAATVRQASGLEPRRDRPAPQISRRGTTMLVEFQ